MSFRIHVQEPASMHEIYQHHPRKPVVAAAAPAPVDAPVAIKLVDPVVKPKLMEIKISAPVVVAPVVPLPPTIPAPSNNVINHPAEANVPLPPIHDVVSSLAPVFVDRSSRSRSPSPAPVPVSEEVVMRIKRRNNK